MRARINLPNIGFQGNQANLGSAQNGLGLQNKRRVGAVFACQDQLGHKENPTKTTYGLGKSQSFHNTYPHSRGVRNGHRKRELAERIEPIMSANASRERMPIVG